jgi:hypothetical protein
MLQALTPSEAWSPSYWLHPDNYRRCSKCLPRFYLQASQELDFWDHTFFHHVRLGALYHDLLRKVLIELLQDVDLQAIIHLCFMNMVPHHIFFLHSELVGCG